MTFAGESIIRRSRRKPRTRSGAVLPRLEAHAGMCGERGFARRALSMVESAVSVMLVSLLLLAAMDTLGASKTSERLTTEQRLGTMLAQDLLDEMMHVDYSGAAQALPTKILGLEFLLVEETPVSCAPPVRACFDDLLDFDNWCESPPQEPDGTEMTEFAGWSRCLRIKRVKAKDFSGVSASDTGFVRIVVETRYEGRRVAELVSLRTSATPLTPELP